MVMAFISLALFSWHYHVSHSCGIQSSPIGLIFLLGAFVGCEARAMTHGDSGSTYPSDPPGPARYCIPPCHYPKVDAIDFMVPLLS